MWSDGSLLIRGGGVMASQIGNPARFPWADVWAFLGWNLTAALVGLVAYTVLMSITIRRFLSGGILEARVACILLHNSWFMGIVLLVPAITALWRHQMHTAILL